MDKTVCAEIKNDLSDKNDVETIGDVDKYGARYKFLILLVITIS
jgi:hypothetical protein